MTSYSAKKRVCEFCEAHYHYQNNKTQYCSVRCRIYAWRDKNPDYRKKKKGGKR